MAGLTAIKAALLRQDHPVIETERVDHGGTHAARSGRADDDHAVAAEKRQIGGKVRPEEPRRLLLPDHDVLRAGRDHRDDLVTIDRMGRTARLIAARALPAPTSSIPIIRTALPGGVDDRQPLAVCGFDKRLDKFERDPALLAAGGAPAFDRLQNGFRPLAAECPIDVYHEQCGSLAEPGACAEPARGEYRLVALGEKLVPNPLGH